MDDFWYYEYAIMYWDEVDYVEEVRTGVVPASSFADAIDQLNKYYGECNIEEIQMLKPIVEGLVLDFEDAKRDHNVNFQMSKE